VISAVKSASCAKSSVLISNLLTLHESVRLTERNRAKNVASEEREPVHDIGFMRIPDISLDLL
jgi:hypothetical protein